VANATVSRLGQVKAAGSEFALFLQQFGGETLTSFNANTILKPLLRWRNISNGRTASFPVIHNASGGYHTPGEEIVGNAIQHNELTVTADDLLISDVFIANIDEAMNHYEVRAPYSEKLGAFLGESLDKNLSRCIYRATAAAELFAGDGGGTQLTNANYDTVATTLAGGIYDAKRTMEEAKLPVDSTPVYAAFQPLEWYMLAQEDTLVLNKDVDGDGSYSKGTLNMIGGVKVLKSNNLRWGNNDANVGPTTDLTKYDADMSNTVGCVFTQDAVASVQLLGLALESDYDIRRQGTLMVGKYAIGHSEFLPKAAVALNTA
jgi:hypothetical protein